MSDLSRTPDTAHREEVDFETIEESFDHMDKCAPLGFRVELMAGEIVAKPLDDGDHCDWLSHIAQQLYLNADDALLVSWNIGVTAPGGRYIPDLTVVCSDTFGSNKCWLDPDEVDLVVEVTSSNGRRERVDKRHHYAVANILLYLLVDRDNRTVTLFGAPDAETEDYRRIHTVEYGEKLPLPEPFGFDLDTSSLP